MMIMMNEIKKLQYKIARYKEMRNGAMCQTLNKELQMLQQTTEK